VKGGGLKPAAFRFFSEVDRHALRLTIRRTGDEAIGGPWELIRLSRLIINVPNRETAMKIAKIILAAAGVLTIVASAALAEQMLNGTITKVDRINNSVAIRQTQSGTVGASTGSAAEEFKTQDGLSLDKLHAGDRVTFSATEKGGVKTITKIQQQ
jgi:Cu/Ag efflux protein CusF